MTYQLIKQFQLLTFLMKIAKVSTLTKNFWALVWKKQVDLIPVSTAWQVTQPTKLSFLVIRIQKLGNCCPIKKTPMI